MKKRLFLLLLVLAARLSGHTPPHSDTPVPLDFEERLGGVVPLEAVFRDEEGLPVRLGDLVDRPTILAFEYFTCQDACGLLSLSLASTLGAVPGAVGKDYRVLTVSFDAADRPDLAREKKRLSLSILADSTLDAGRSAGAARGNASPPAAGWRFLTGDGEAIEALTSAVGFRFERRGDDFVHPIGLVFLSPAGKVVRYIRGERFLPADITFSLLEASSGTIGPTLSRVARFCFDVDPAGRKLTFNILRVGGTVILAFVAGFLVLLLVRGRRMKSS